MTLEEKAYLACWRLRKIHKEIELSDYQRVMKHYDPDIPAFEIILNKVEEITNEISKLDEFIASV